MDTSRLFQSGRSQAVRLPKAYRFSGSEVVVKHFGNEVLLLPIDDPWQTLEAGLAAFEPGFVITREQPEEQIREAINPIFCSIPTSAITSSTPNQPRSWSGSARNRQALEMFLAHSRFSLSTSTRLGPMASCGRSWSAGALRLAPSAR